MVDTSDEKLVELHEISGLIPIPRDIDIDYQKEIESITYKLREKIQNLNLQELGVDKLRIAFDIEGVLLEKRGKGVMPLAQEVLEAVHKVFNEDCVDKAEAIIWTSANKLFATNIITANPSFEVPKGMRILTLEDNIKALEKADIPYVKKKNHPLKKIYESFLPKTMKSEKRVINKKAKIPTLHNVHALIDDHAKHHEYFCAEANHPSAGNFILGNLEFGSEESLIEVLKKLDTHIDNLSTYI